MSDDYEFSVRITEPREREEPKKRLEFRRRYDPKYSASNVERLSVEELEETYAVIGHYLRGHYLARAATFTESVSPLTETAAHPEAKEGSPHG